MTYNELIYLYDNNEFREIDKQPNAKKFYLLRSISKAKTLKLFCQKNRVPNDLNFILNDDLITEEVILKFIKNEFTPKDADDIKRIETELNKMQFFDWGGSMGNQLEKNIVNNYVKKILSYNELELAISSCIQRSVYGYTMNSWYNHWSAILLEEIFNSHKKITPTVDLVKKIDFFIEGVPFDLKVTYFPEELMSSEIGDDLYKLYKSKNELTCMKKVAKELNIAIPKDLNSKSLKICLYKILEEQTDDKAKKFIRQINSIKLKVLNYYKNNPNELIVWLYENQGEMRFDAANRYYVVLVDEENIFDSWKLKRNANLIRDKVNEHLNLFSSLNLNMVKFFWKPNGKVYTCISELLFISK